MMPVSLVALSSQASCNPFHSSQTTISSTPSPSQLPVTHEIKASHSTDVGACVPSKAKQSCSLSFPSSDNRPSKRAKTNAPVSTGRRATWKCEALEKIDNGTWVRDTKKWDRYITKLKALNAPFEVSDEPRYARSVKHIQCGSWILMSVPYDVTRFKSHIKMCSYSTASGGMRTLDSYGILVCPMDTQSPLPSIPSTSSSPSHTNLPCPGITEKNDIRITQYMKHTPSKGGGGINIQDIAKELFSDLFKNLSQKDKDIMRQKQEQTCSWSNDHIRKSVHAIGKDPCDGKACLDNDRSLKPCNQCLALLALRSFQNAISRPCVENENRVFTPHIFQSPDVGRIFSLGLYELLDGVRATTILTQ